MTLHEPATFVTDLMLAALGAAFVIRLKRNPTHSKAAGWWTLSIGLMSVSAFAGACYHGFAPELPPVIETWWWRVVLWIICGLGFAMGTSLLHELKPRGGFRTWQVLLAAKFAISSVTVLFKPEFIVAMADYGSAMIAWAFAAAMVLRPWRGPILTGVGLSMLAAVVQQAQWGLSRHFNHNDVFHLIQACALVAFYQAGKALAGSSGTFSAPQSPGSSRG